ncbi:hypothetical protein H4C80_17790 [Pseudomonas juntendi]|uniref:Uncharacterized protein n=1 Tax=Pseudomonas juntendi TaxID=2666183 RepID=A0A7W2KIH3_9PSED|nr:hypothetical protein [Pseudomonas juntendi]MBA6098962.1 hypothetical protein [Pseudomonas juntendi]
MPYLFSPRVAAFYHTDIPYPDLPDDVQEVSDEEHESIMEDLLMQGMALQADPDGAPRAVAMPEAAASDEGTAAEPGELMQ